MKSTMSRYMDPELADQLMNAGDSDDIMGGKQSIGTVLFLMYAVLQPLLKNWEPKVQLSY